MRTTRYLKYKCNKKYSICSKNNDRCLYRFIADKVRVKIKFYLKKAIKTLKSNIT